MNYLDAFRDGALARRMAAALADEARGDRQYRFMEFCGGHTHTLARYGVEALLPANVQMIHGPGCPVCVLPSGRIAAAIELALRPGVILCSYGDVLRVPGRDGDSLMKARARGADVRVVYSTQDALALARQYPAADGMSLLRAKARGADVRMVYSSADAVKIAQENPQQQVVFFAIGFETTTPATAVALREARREGLSNFSVFCNHVLTPAAMAGILAAPDARRVRLDGFVGPGHVSAVSGTRAFARFTGAGGYPVVIAGFEPLDILQAVRMLIRQCKAGRAELENEYSRVVTEEGNAAAQAVMAEVFCLRDSFEWRGLGELPRSALRLRDEFANFDAERKFAVSVPAIADHKACECGAVLRGLTRPEQCKVFGTVCTPDNPLGSCMVSSEGACSARYRYGRVREARAGA